MKNCGRTLLSQGVSWPTVYRLCYMYAKWGTDFDLLLMLLTSRLYREHRFPSHPLDWNVLRIQGQISGTEA